MIAGAWPRLLALTAVMAAWVALAQDTAEPPAPEWYDRETGTVRSHRMAGGLPLGGIGCGAIELMTDGSFAHATSNNNWEHPTGDIRGAFASVWTSAAGRTAAKTLQLRNPYGLPSAGETRFRGVFPQAFVEFPDRALPARVSMRAYSALIPHDVRNSSVPAVLVVIRITNTARGPIEAAAALSWESILGIGGAAATGPFSDRTGNTVSEEPAEKGFFALRFGMEPSPSPPESRLRYNARGTYALGAEAIGPELKVTQASWNALESRPAWWEEFARSGTVSGQTGIGREGVVHPAGVISVRADLRDRETREFPFVIAWHTPRFWTMSGHEYGHLYEKSFPDAVAVARYALQNRLSTAALIEEWQEPLLRSTLPAWLSRKLVNDAAVLYNNTLITRDGGLPGPNPGPSLFAVLENPGDGKGALGALDQRLPAQELFQAFYPSLERKELRQMAGAQAESGELPRATGALDDAILPEKRPREIAGGAYIADAAASFVYHVYRHYRTAGDQQILDALYPPAKHALEFASALDRNEDGIPDDAGAMSAPRSVPTTSSGVTRWIGALLAARQMAGVMKDTRFIGQLDSWLARARDTLRERYLAGEYLRLTPESEFSLSTQLAGQWLADRFEVGTVLEPATIERILDHLMRRHPGGGLFAEPKSQSPESGETAPGLSAVFQAALYALRGRADAGLELMRRLDRLMVERAGLPWQAPLLLDAESGQPLTPLRHISGAGSWSFYSAILGVSVDMPEGRMILAPSLPAAIKTLDAPVFSPTFLGRLQYQPGARRTFLSFRLNRYIPVPEEPVKLQISPGLTLKSVIIPAPRGAATRVSASLSRAPVPGSGAELPGGRLLYTFESPLRLIAGDRLEFVLR